jgi:hypothetical protein
MHASVAFGTEGYQILLRIIARRAAEFFVMEFKIGHCATRLASPAVATQHLLAQTVILIGIEPHEGNVCNHDTEICTSRLWEAPPCFFRESRARG